VIQVGDPAADLSLMTIDGQRISLADIWRGGNSGLLVFLRHLG